MPTPPAKRQKRNKDEAQKQTQIQREGTDGAKMPKKKFFRQRAHANPFSDHNLEYPISPAHMDWTSHFPEYVDSDPSKGNLSGARKLLKDVEVADIGCGFGGLLVGLAPLMPDTLMVGMEIRPLVLEYVRQRIDALRAQQKQLKTSTSSDQPNPETEPSSTHAQSAPDDSNLPAPGGYQNIAAHRSNTMKFLPNFFAKGQLSKIFICFPDPHFKARKHKARIISETLNAEYAYVLRPGGLLYTITDVEEYHRWILNHFHEMPAKEEVEAKDADNVQSEEDGIKDLWERVSDEELQNDPCVQHMKDSTEEGQKVSRNNGLKCVAVFRRKADPEWPA